MAPGVIPLRTIMQLFWPIVVILLLSPSMDVTNSNPMAGYRSRYITAFVVAEAHIPKHHSINRIHIYGRESTDEGTRSNRPKRGFCGISRSGGKESGDRFSAARRSSPAFLPSSAKPSRITDCRRRLEVSNPVGIPIVTARRRRHHLIVHHENNALSHLRYSPFTTTVDTAATTTLPSRIKMCGETILHAATTDDDDIARVGIDMDTLTDMDIVLFSQKEPENDTDDDRSTTAATGPSFQLGAIQEDGTLAPLSAWTLEEAFANPEGCGSMEFVVDEEDRWIERLKPENVVVHSVLDADAIGYGSRQVGGGKGLGNPHGEESELLYYVEKDALEEMGVEVVVKPNLEILW